MSERLEIADWLFGHAELYDEAASQYRNRNISAELLILASETQAIKRWRSSLIETGCLCDAMDDMQ